MRVTCFTTGVFMCVSLALTMSAAYAGEPPALFDAVDGRDTLSKAQDELLERLDARATTGQRELAKVRELGVLEQGGDVRVGLLSRGEVVLIGRKVERRSEGEFSYFGRVDGFDGTAVLVVRRGQITGSVRLETELYRIVPLGSGMHAIVEVHSESFPDCVQGLESGTAGGEIPASITESSIDEGSLYLVDARLEPSDDSEVIMVPPAKDLSCEDADAYANAKSAKTNPVITVIVAYTPAADDEWADIEAMIQLAVDESNDSFANSDVDQRFELVETIEVNYTESGNFSTDLDRFRATNDGFMDEVHSERDQHLADVAVLIIDDDTYCGLASGIGSTESTAFVVVHHDCATGNYSFGHEIGHIQGCRHDNDSGTSPYAYAHGYYYSSGAWRTIMAVYRSGVERIQHWSNPDINYLGHATGTSSTNDCARGLDTSAPSVALYRPSYADRVLPSASDGSSCSASNIWFKYGSCGEWKEYTVPPNRWLGMYAYGDSCSGCVLWHINFEIQEYHWLLGWQTKETHNPGDDYRGMVYTTVYKPGSDKVRIRANEGFYMKMYALGVDNGGFETGSAANGWLVKDMQNYPSITSNSTYVAHRGVYSLGNVGGGTTGTNTNDRTYWGYGKNVPDFEITSASRLYFDTYADYYSQYAHYHVKVWWTTGGTTIYDAYVDFNQGIPAGWAQQAFAFPSSAWDRSINAIEVTFHKDHLQWSRYKPTIFMDNMTLR